jgi:DNA-binding PadR family transcriptional regulator
MRSPVNWALLGLIIERESYAFELAQRFQKIYQHTLKLSSTSHIYTALGVLEDRGLVEQIAGLRPGRQPKPSYRATAPGVEGYAEWLISYVREDRRSQALFVLGLSALAGNPDWVAEILERVQREWQAQQRDSQPLSRGGVPDGPGADLSARILAVENELTVAAKLAWLKQVRDALADHAQSAEGDAR